MRSTVIMKLSDWLLGTYDGVACISGWLCSCLLSLGVFSMIFSDSWCRNHYFICCFLMFDHEIALIWCCDYFRATIYCAALPPTVILFVVLITIFHLLLLDVRPWDCFDLMLWLFPCDHLLRCLTSYCYFICCFDYNSSLTPFLFLFSNFLFCLCHSFFHSGIFSLFYRSCLSVRILFFFYWSYLSARTFVKNCIVSGLSINNWFSSAISSPPFWLIFSSGSGNSLPIGNSPLHSRSVT